MRLVLSLCLLFFALSFSLIEEASANCGSCSARTCSVDRGSQKAFDQAKEDLQKAFYPGRLVQLLYRMSPRCTSCLESMDKTVKIMFVTNGTKTVRPWSPPLERRLRRALKAGTIEAFYIMVNNGRKCSCCDSGSYKDLDDYDEDLGINRSGPVFIFENPRQVGLNPNDFGDSSSNHYSPAPQSNPPARTVNRPSAPRVIHALCTKCQIHADGYNGALYQEYGYEEQFYYAHRETNVAATVLVGLHNEKRGLYNDSSLSETQFFQAVNELDGRIKEWQDRFDASSSLLENIRGELRGLGQEVPQKRRALDQCEASPACKNTGPIVKDPRPAERIACNEATPRTAPFVFEDLDRIDFFFDRAAPKLLSCNNDFQCAKMTCDDVAPIKDLAVETQQRLAEAIAWAKLYKDSSFKHYKSLTELSIQSQTNKSDTEFVLAVQTYFHDLSSNIMFFADLMRFVQDMAKKPTSPNETVNRTRRQEILKKLNEADAIYEMIATSAQFLNTNTKDVQFPTVEGEGVPGLRVFNNHIVSLIFCLKSTASELKDLILNVRAKDPNWKTNVLGFVVKGLQCVSIVQAMERQKYIDQVEKDILAENVALENSFNHHSCVVARHHRMEDVLEKANLQLPAMKTCMDGACGDSKVPDAIQLTAEQRSYGRALKIFEPIINELSQKFVGQAQKLVFTESPDPIIDLEKLSYLPNESLMPGFEIPWCEAKQAWIGIVDSSAPHGPRSVEDQGLKTHLPLRGKWNGLLDLRAPHLEGDYDLRIYSSGVNGKEIVSKSFKTSSHLGPLENRQSFTRLYKRDLASEFVAPEFPQSEIKAGHGRVLLTSLDAAQKVKPNYVYVNKGGQRVYGGWETSIDLPPGEYEMIFTKYIPQVVILFNLRAGQVLPISVGGDGRLKLIAQDALGLFKDSYKYIRRSSDQELIHGGWETELDIEPGTYDIEYTSFVPPIVHRGVVVEEKKLSTLMASGYGRLKMNPKDALGEDKQSYVYINDSTTGQRLYGGWDMLIDLPPGTYDLEFTSYTPHYHVKGVRVDKGLISATSAGAGYGRVDFKLTDAAEKVFQSYVYVKRASDKQVIYGGWDTTLDLPKGEYIFEFTSYTPHLSVQAEVYTGRKRSVFGGGYGRLIMNKITDIHVNFEDMNGNRIHSGWENQVDLPPGTYKLIYRINSREFEKVVRIQKHRQTTISL